MQLQSGHANKRKGPVLSFITIQHLVISYHDFDDIMIENLKNIETKEIGYGLLEIKKGGLSCFITVNFKFK